MKKCNTNVQVQGVGFAIVLTGLFKYLWNKLFPELFGWKKITYWQSVMLYVISKALFDFRYDIKDSFNFGNNSINSDGVSKKKTTTEATSEAVTEAVEEIKEEAIKDFEFIQEEKVTEEANENSEEEEVVELEKKRKKTKKNIM